MDGSSYGRRVRAANTLARAWRRRLPPKSRKLSRFSKWYTPGKNRPGGEYSFTRIASSNATGSVLSLATDALGVTKFFVGANNSDNLQVDFSLQNTNIKLGGTTQITSVLPDYGEFANLFDQWCIDKVELFIIPSYSTLTMNSAANFQLPNMVHVTDDDDSTAGSKLVLQEYGNARYTQLLNGTSDPKPLRVFRPKPAMAVYQTGATFAYGELIKGPKWIDVAYPTVPHYSFKMALDNANVSGTANQTVAYLDVMVKYHFRFKSVR